MSQREIEDNAERDFVAQNRDANRLLGAMLDESSSKLSSLSGEHLSDSQKFRVFMLSQSWNAAVSAVLQLRRGFPRTALLVPRFISEGVVAAIWAENDPEAAEQCMQDYSEGKKWPVGTWPDRKVMAEALPRWYDDNALEAFRLFRDTENILYSHALSDLAIDAVRADSPQLEVLLGMRTTKLSEIAARHLVPTLAALLYAIARLVDEVTGANTSAAAQLHNQALEWSVDNPPEVHIRDRRA